MAFDDRLRRLVDVESCTNLGVAELTGTDIGAEEDARIGESEDADTHRADLDTPDGEVGCTDLQQRFLVLLLLEQIEVRVAPAEGGPDRCLDFRLVGKRRVDVSTIAVEQLRDLDLAADVERIGGLHDILKVINGRQGVLGLLLGSDPVCPRTQ